MLRKKEEKKEIKNLKKEQKEQKKEEKEYLKLEKKKNKRIRKNVKKNLAEIFNITDFEDDLIKTKSGYMNIFQIQSKDIYSFNSSESNTHISEFARFLRMYQGDIKLVVMNFPVNTYKQKRYVVGRQNKIESDVCKDILDQKLIELENLERKRKNKEFYIFTFSKDLKEEEDNRLLLKRTSSPVFTIDEVDINKKKQILYKLNNQNSKVLPNFSEINKDINIKKGDYNPIIINEIQPQGGINFKDKFIQKGDGYEACIYIYHYPSQVPCFWLYNLMNHDNVIVTIDVGTSSKDKALKSINRSLVEQKSRYRTDRDEIIRIEAQDSYQKLHNLASTVANHGEVIKEIHSRIFVSAKTKSELENEVKKILGTLEGSNFRGVQGLNEQKFDWQSLFCSLSEQNNYKNKRTAKAIPATSLAGGYPFYFTSLDDPTGLYLGQTFTGGNVNFDIFTNTEVRNFYNSIIVGMMGAGKSTLLKKMIVSNHAVGNTTRFFDFTGECRQLIKHLKGKVISLDGIGDDNIEIINPLQILATVVDNVTYEVKDKESYMMHMSKVSMMYQFIAEGAGNDEQREFDRLLSDFYKSYGIEMDKATKYKANEYPIMSDFLLFIKSQFYEDIGTQKIKENLSTGSKNRIESIILNIESLVREYGSLFDGHSSITNLEDEDLISFELGNLTQMDKRILNVQIFNILTLIWNNALTQGRKEKSDYENNIKSLEDAKKFLLIIDESHRIINSNNIMAVDYLISCSREFRKYFGGIAFATQSIRDVAPIDVSSEALEKLKTLFELTQYKFIMKQDPGSLPVLGQIFDGQISESELEMIPKLKKGRCILSINGLHNIKFAVSVSKQELDLFAGGA